MRSGVEMCGTGRDRQDQDQRCRQPVQPDHDQAMGRQGVKARKHRHRRQEQSVEPAYRMTRAMAISASHS